MLFTLDLFPNQAKVYVFRICIPAPPQPSPTGEGAVLRQIQIATAVSHMDSYETVAIFAANESPPPVGGGLGWGQQTTAQQVWNLVVS